jgi:hypothetical protein
MLQVRGQVLALSKRTGDLLKQRSSQFNPNDLPGELGKALASPKTPGEIEVEQAQSPRFQPRFSQQQGEN